ncbi:MAG: AmmeMemoRadiSam system protein A [Bacillota bacterium]|jgi:AmmeMemoRadiSam system protein A
MIDLGVLAPHPPLLVPGIGGATERARLTETIAAMAEVDQMLGADPPETIIVFTPHGTVYRDAIIIYEDEFLTGDLAEFGLERTWSWPTDQELATAIWRLGREAGLPVYLIEHQEAVGQRRRCALDHGVLVPLSFFDPQWAAQVKLVVIPISMLPLIELYQFGIQIRQAVAELGRKTMVLASGDLTHCLVPNGPYPYDPRGAEFDRKFLDLLQRAAVRELLDFDPVLLEKAAQCGFPSVIMLLGTLEGVTFQTRLLSYQGPFGVGYAIATLQPGEAGAGYLDRLWADRRQAVADRRAGESPVVKFARQVIEAKVNEANLPAPDGLEAWRQEHAGVFVSIKKFGELRGCIGTINPTRDNLVEEVQYNAIAAATGDPRFEPVAADELDDLVYSVDVLKPAEAIAGMAELDPKRYGAIVRQGRRQGLLLPNLEGVETAAEQVAIAKRKAGITKGPVELQRFEVVRYY